MLFQGLDYLTFLILINMKNRNTTNETMDQLKKMAENLESMILDTDLNVKEANKKDLPPSNSAIKPLNYDALQKETDTKAEDIVESVIMLYLPKEFIREHEYVRQKMSVDMLTVSNLIFQMKTSEHAIKKLLEEIDMGNIHARSFEVLASLQKSKMDIVKHLAQFMVVMENNYKNLKFDYENAKAEKAQPVVEIEQEASSNLSKFRGTKSLVEMINNAIKTQEQYEEIK